MRKTYLLSARCTILYIAIISSTNAAPVSFDFDYFFTEVSGDYAGDILSGYRVYGSYVYDTDENNASAADTTPGTIPGHEYTSRYRFDGAAYGAGFTIDELGDGFTDWGTVEVLVNDSLPLTSAETGGFLDDGTYDWIEILASTTVDTCPSGASCPPYTPGDGQEWTLAIFGANDWFTDGSMIPDALPTEYKALLVGFEFNSNGDEVGAAFAPSPVPVPAAAWLFCSGLMGLVVVARRRRLV